MGYPPPPPPPPSILVLKYFVALTVGHRVMVETAMHNNVYYDIKCLRALRCWELPAILYTDS